MRKPLEMIYSHSHVNIGHSKENGRATVGNDGPGYPYKNGKGANYRPLGP